MGKSREITRKECSRELNEIYSIYDCISNLQKVFYFLICISGGQNSPRTGRSKGHDAKGHSRQLLPNSTGIQKNECQYFMLCL